MNVASISVLVVRYLDDPRLESCLLALKAQRDVGLDVVLIENAASVRADRGGEAWKAPGGAVKSIDCVTREANPGFAASFNEAWARARGDLVLSVNPDCRLDPEAVRCATAALLSDPGLGAVALRLWRPGRELLDSAGIVVSPLLFRARDRGRGKPGAGCFGEPSDVDAVCLAGALLERGAVESARDGAGEVLDSRYFAYQEDVDLGCRIRRAGFRIRYEPTAVGEHDRGWREGGRREMPVGLRRLSLRNRWFTILKNVSWSGLVWRLPFLCAFEMLLFLKLLVTEPAVVPAFRMAVAGVRETIARRTANHDADRKRRHSD